MKYYGDRDIENGMIVNSGWSDTEIDPVYYCDMCSEPIYDGDPIFHIFGNKICECCVEDCKRKA